MAAILDCYLEVLRSTYSVRSVISIKMTNQEQTLTSVSKFPRFLVKSAQAQRQHVGWVARRGKWLVISFPTVIKRMMSGWTSTVNYWLDWEMIFRGNHLRCGGCHLMLAPNFLSTQKVLSHHLFGFLTMKIKLKDRFFFRRSTWGHNGTLTESSKNSSSVEKRFKGAQS